MAQARFLFQLPFVIAVFCVTTVALVYLTAIADVQGQLAQQSSE